MNDERKQRSSGGGLGALPDAPTVARIVQAATGEAAEDLRIAGQGVTAVGWRVEARGGPYCVLVALPREAYQDAYPDADAQFEARFAVLSALHERDARCPRPIATDRSDGVPEGLGSWRWMVTSWVDGEPATTPIPDGAAREAGEVLAALHTIPSTGYGMLVDTADAIRGRVDEPGGDFTSRWGDEIWPYHGRPLASHSLARVAPHLLVAAAALREPLLAYADVPSRAVCHTDVSGAHLLLRDGHLAGFIDFGDTAIVPPAFDIASFAYYFGWSSTDRLLEGYEPNSVLRDLRRAEAQQVAVALALQKVEKRVRRQPDPVLLRSALDFLEETLPLAARRMDA